MANTLRRTCQIVSPDANVYPDKISNQITTSNPVGNFVAYVTDDAVGADNGNYYQVNIPENFGSGAKAVIKCLLNGSPAAGAVLGFGVKGLAVADNESEDQAFSAEDANSAVIGSSGLNYADKDMLEMIVTLTNLGALAARDLLLLYVYLDVSVTTYTGKPLIQSVELQYDDNT